MTRKLVLTDNIKNMARTKAPLFRQYDGQINPQDAYVEIDPRGEAIVIDADYYAGTDNSFPAYIWEGKAHRFAVSPCVHGPALYKVLSSENFARLAEQLCAITQDTTTETMADIDIMMNDMMDDIPRTQIWNDAAEWFGESVTAYNVIWPTEDHDDATRFVVGDYTITAATTDDDISRHAEHCDIDMEDDQAVVGIAEYFTSLRDICLSNTD